MTDQISSVAAPQGYQPQRRSDVPPEPTATLSVQAAANNLATARPSTAAPPIALSVDRDGAGVFVYTLTDSVSGRVLAVIPRSGVVTSAQQPAEGVDIQA